MIRWSLDKLAARGPGMHQEWTVQHELGNARCGARDALESDRRWWE
jgi:hypothetical protein